MLFTSDLVLLSFLLTRPVMPGTRAAGDAGLLTAVMYENDRPQRELSYPAAGLFLVQLLNA